MAITEWYVDPAINGNSGTGTIGDPFGDLAYALTQITRDATNGDRINIKSGTAEVMAAAMNLATYGTPTTGVPLVIQGYTSAAGDGGRGEINNGGANVAIYNSSTVPVSFIDMKLGNTGTAAPLTIGPGAVVARCEIHSSSGSPFFYGAAYAMPVVVGCYLHDLTGAYLLRVGSGNVPGGFIYGNYMRGAAAIYGIYINGYGSVIVNNVIAMLTDTTSYGIYVDRGNGIVANNSVYCNAANTQYGIYAKGPCAVVNNIIQGWSGAGGVGLLVDSMAGIVVSGGNAYYNNTTPEAETGYFHFALAANDTLGASPFVNAGAGDFTIDGTVVGVTEDGYPQAWPGLTTSTAPKPDKGAVQAGAGTGGGGAVSISPLRGGLGG